MRTIKFRAWDKQNKTFHTWGALKHLPLWEYIDNQNYELIQFTGLKDKNGKEIYEGDILIHYKRDRVTAVAPVYKVCWSEKFARFILKFRNVWNDGKPILYEGFGNKIIEVIGNIYENPKLLNSEKE